MKIFLLVFLVGCAGVGTTFGGRGNEAPQGFKITQIDNPKVNYSVGGGKVKIQYVTYDSLVEKAKSAGKNELKSDSEIKKSISLIPKGGRIYVYTYRLTVEAGNTKFFSYAIEENNKIVSKRKGASSVPDTPSRYGMDGAFWSNLDIVEVPKKFNKRIKFYVIDKLSNTRDEFTILKK